MYIFFARYLISDCQKKIISCLVHKFINHHHHLVSSCSPAGRIPTIVTSILFNPVLNSSIHLVFPYFFSLSVIPIWLSVSPSANLAIWPAHRHFNISIQVLCDFFAGGYIRLFFCSVLLYLTWPFPSQRYHQFIGRFHSKSLSA